jgi:hypothetical protein
MVSLLVQLLASSKLEGSMRSTTLAVRIELRCHLVFEQRNLFLKLFNLYILQHQQRF